MKIGIIVSVYSFPVFPGFPTKQINPFPLTSSINESVSPISLFHTIMHNLFSINIVYFSYCDNFA